jgi:Tfp pilus assembly protein PilN
LLTISGEKTYEDLQAIESDYNSKIADMNKVLNNYPYLILNLNALPQLLPEGTWFNELIFRQTESGGKELLLRGIAYLEDRNKEFDAINTFFSNIKSNQAFLKNFKIIEIASIEHSRIGSGEVTAFVISCKR